MGLFKYPYTDLNELNLDWVIARIKELTEYVATITNADQISYDNTGTVLSADNVQDAITEIQTIITTASVVSFNGRTGAVVPAAGDYDANIVDYDNTNSGLSATETQSAIDELAARPLGGVESFNTRTGAVLPAGGDYEAGDITYDNTTSGLTATDTQAAIDELDNRIDNFTVAAGQVTYDNTQSGLTATDAQAAIDEIANDVLSSGVASFNGRTGAVNPVAGDYDASDITYDNTGSGLAATDVQDAIDELESDLHNDVIIKTTATFTNTSTTDDLQTRLADISNQALTYIQALATNEYAIIERIYAHTTAFLPETHDKLSNSASNVSARGFYVYSNPSNQNTFISYVRINKNLTNNEITTTKIETTPAISFTDYANTTHSGDVSLDITVYKTL